MHGIWGSKNGYLLGANDPSPKLQFFRFLVIELTSNVCLNEGTIFEVKMKFKNLLFRAQNHCEMEEEMATHFTILAGKIPWTEEPDRL